MRNNPEFQEILSKLRAAETNGWSNMSEPTQTQLASSLSEFLFRSLGENKMHQPLGIQFYRLMNINVNFYQETSADDEEEEEEFDYIRIAELP